MQNRILLLVLGGFFLLAVGYGLGINSQKDKTDKTDRANKTHTEILPETSKSPATSTISPSDQSTSRSVAITDSLQAFDTATVTKVIDGDTIQLNTGKTVRYIGIDTPETKDPRRGVQCFGVEASAKNKELVEGKVVRLEKDVSETDKYGRLLRYVYVGDPSTSSGYIFINQVLVEEGFAHASSYPPDIKHQPQFQESQTIARENKKGLWGACESQSVQESSSKISQTGGDKDCSDFTTQKTAQDFFISQGGPANDPHKLDQDHDGVVCESLP